MDRKIVCTVVLISMAAASQAVDIWIGRFFQNTVSRYSLPDGASRGNVGGGAVGGPLGMARMSNGDVLATSESTNTIRRYSAAGLYLGNFATEGLAGPTAVAIDKAGFVFAANFNNSTVSRYSPQGAFLGTWISANVNQPDLGMEFGPDGNLYVPNYGDHRITKFNGSTGAYLGDFVPSGSGGLIEPRQILWRGGLMYVASDSGNKVLRYNAITGAFVDTFIPAGSGGLSGTIGMAFLGNSLYVSSSRNGRLLKYDANSGSFQGIALSGLGSPAGLMVVPEPSTTPMLIAGIGALVRRRKRP